MANHTAEYYREYYQKNKAKKQEYNRNYSRKYRYGDSTRIEAYIKRTDLETLKEKLKKENSSVAEFIRNAINEYINKKD